MLESKNIKAVLFDFDDTLVQTKKTKYSAIKAIGKRYYNHEFTDEAIDKHWGIAFQKFYQELFKEIETDLGRVLALRDSISKEFPNELFSDTSQVLTYLKKKYKVGIVTASAKNTIKTEIKQTGLNTDGMLFIQTAEDTIFHKPDHRVFKPALEKLKSEQIDTAEIIYVGDSLKDYHAAKSANMHFVGIAEVTTTTEIFKKEGAYSVKSLGELLDIL
ncbi:MAG: HAD-IA family hydrolase [Bacteroidota bacterium]